jgi:hypothetical protein
MSKLRFVLSIAALLLLPTGQRCAFGEGGEIGFGGGGSIYTEATVTAPGGEAKAGFDNSFAGGAWAGHDMYRYLGGEIHYVYQQNGLKLSAGGTKVAFSGRSHAIHYDVLIHTSPTGSKVRPFIAVGGGIKGYFGTGAEAVTQPLQEYAILSKTSEWKPLVSVAGGVKIALGAKVNLRIEFRDYMTQVPTAVIAPVPGAELGGWIHNFVPMFGLAFTF